MSNWPKYSMQISFLRTLIASKTGNFQLKFLWLWLSLLYLPQGAYCAVTVPDQRGMFLVLEKTPERIVSLLPSLTESVCALGACGKLVGTDRFSNTPPAVLALPKLGGIDDVQIERIVQLHPDVVLAAPFTRAIDRLEQLGLKVLVIDSNSHGDVHRSLSTLAQMLGVPLQAKKIWDTIERDLQSARAKVPLALMGKRVYFEIDASIYAAGQASFIGQTLARLGLGNIVPATLGPFPKLNPEFVVRAQPDIVMAVESGLASMHERPGWSQLRALQNGRTCGFSSEHYELLIRPGPRLGEAAHQLAFCLASLPK
jgi:iron complex transport system substrate-binding protein